MTPAGVARRSEGSLAYVYLAAIVAATAGLLFGFDIAVINGAILLLKQQFQLGELETEFAASALLAGCIVGAGIAGPLSDRFGRRGILIVSAILFAISSIGAALPRNLTEFAAARLLGGVAIGMASVLAPLYIAEVSPPHIRGRLVSLNQMAIVTGILLAYLVNWLLSYLGPNSWRWMFAVAAIPSLAFLAALFFVPESPRWLMEKGRDALAMRILTRIGGPTRAAEEAAGIRSAIADESGTFRELLEPRLRRAMLIGIALAILQQVTGINTVLFYGSIIFKEQVGNHSESSAIGANVIVGAINFFSTIAALWLIDKVGRKPLLIVSAGMMAVCELVIGAMFLRQPPPGTWILGAILLCVASFAIGLGPGVWTVMSEIYPNRVRGRAMSVATVSLWIACWCLTATFLSLVRAVTITGAFAVYASMCVITMVLVWRSVPETSGKTLEQIERSWH